MDPPGLKRRLTCILATDAFGYSRLVNEDETGALRVLAAHRAVIDGIIAFHDGRIANTAGDSVLAEFGSVVEGVRCAVEIQDALKTRNESLPEQQRMLFRIGINLGEVVVKGTTCSATASTSPRACRASRLRYAVREQGTRRQRQRGPAQRSCPSTRHQSGLR